ncbi:hypothetical protein [Variovorax boronicumulans]|uniref:hypothetical protein n=1 Tax=Variovorax boronicumulans TaxID=436515 RepID=UPI0012E4113F|nr:hypothetical protein [Variovorax boronicumulans]GER18458.1 hypothetical protein VCH24_34850 [Variovorax boronicumulans]
MTTVVRRDFRSVPSRDAMATWTAIVALLTQGQGGDRERELLSVAGIASSLIADQAAKDAPIVVTCDGPRTRIYCLYDDDSLDDSGSGEDKLGYEPLKGDWQVSLPCPQEDLDWVSQALGRLTKRIVARDLAEGISADSKAASAVAAPVLNLESFFKS